MYARCIADTVRQTVWSAAAAAESGDRACPPLPPQHAHMTARPALTRKIPSHIIPCTMYVRVS